MKIHLSRRSTAILILIQVAIDFALILNAWQSALFNAKLTNVVEVLLANQSNMGL